MKTLSSVIAVGLVLMSTSVGFALVVVDEDFNSYAPGSVLAGQGTWIGPFFQDGGDPRDTDGPIIATSPVSGEGLCGRWRSMDGLPHNFVTVTALFPGEWTNGTAVMYIDVGMDATNGPGNFSYFQMLDGDGNEATRIYLRRNSDNSGDIHILGRTTPGGNLWLPNIVTNPANNVLYKLKLEVDITNRKYDCYVGDGDRGGVNEGHWGRYEGTTLVLDGQPAVDDIYFYYGATGLAKFTWLMYRYGDSFSGPAYAYCDNLYIEGPDDAEGVRRTEIWVANGTYNEQVTLREYAHVVGGFAGHELSKTDRDGAANPTVIDATGFGAGARAVTGADRSSIDGFTIRGHYGVDCGESAVQIHNNVISNCAGAGVLCGTGSPVIAHNTIVMNGTGILCSDGNPVARGNIVTLNNKGIEKTGGTLSLVRNDVTGNTIDYIGVTPGADDISVDPEFANPASGNYRLSLGSPCIDAGDPAEELFWDKDALCRPNDGDADGQAAIDLGAFEFQSPPPVALAAAKALPSGTSVRCDDVVVSASFDGFFYVQTQDRVCGIRVEMPGHGATIGMLVDVIGILDTNEEGELCIVAAWVDAVGTNEPFSLAMPGKSVGGSGFFFDEQAQTGQRGTSAYTTAENPRTLRDVPGLNNVGLLLTVAGEVTASEGNTFCVDDGSGLDDGDPAKAGVKVVVPAGVSVPSAGTHVRVTGVSSCYAGTTGLRRLIRVRTAQDIEPL